MMFAADHHFAAVRAMQMVAIMFVLPTDRTCSAGRSMQNVSRSETSLWHCHTGNENMAKTLSALHARTGAACMLTQRKIFAVPERTG